MNNTPSSNGVLTPNALEILKKRYLLKDENGKLKETPEQLFRRVANAVAKAETEHGASDEEVKEWADKFYGMMWDLDFLPNSPVLVNLGVDGKGSASACFVLTPQDSMNSIMKIASDAAMIEKWGGGVGFGLSKIRPKNDNIATTHGKALGPVQVMKIFSFIGESITQGSFRLGAHMAQLICLEGESLISTIDGKIPIKELVGHRPYVYCTDGNKVLVRQAERVFHSGSSKKLLRVWFDNDNYLDCTPEHKIRMSGGTYKPANLLTFGDSVCAFYKSLNDKGYKTIGITGKISFRPEHVAVAEMKYGIDLPLKGYNIHHVNHNKLDNNPDNLVLITRHEHGNLHKDNLDAPRRIIAKNRKGKRLEDVYDKDLVLAWKEKMSLAQKRRFSKNAVWNKGMGGEEYKQHYVNGFSNQFTERSEIASNHKVMRVEELEGGYDVYDMTIPDVHNFVANDIFVHNCSHPDIREFIHCKDNSYYDNAISNFNISVQVTDDFMRAVQTDGEWNLINPRNTEIVEVVKAKELWNEICEAAWRTGDPGLCFIDRVWETQPNPHLGFIESSNPSMPAGVLICTKDGIFPIEELEGKEFQVKSLDGSWADGICFLSGENEEVFEINFGANKNTYSTKQHKWPVLDEGKIVKKYTHELLGGDLIPLNRHELTGIEGDTSLTREEGFFVGYLLGDGWITTRKTGKSSGEFSLGATFSPAKIHLAEPFLKSLNALKDSVSNLIMRCDNESTVQTTHQATINTIFNRYGFPKSKEEGLPCKIWTSNDDFIAGFIDGLISSDGYIDEKGRVILSTFRRKIAEDFSKLLSFYGISSNIREDTRDNVKFPNGKDYNRTYSLFYVTLGRFASLRFRDLFHLSHLEKQKRLESIPQTKKDKITNYYGKVKSVKFYNKAKVWDISINHPQHVLPSQHVYTSNCGEQYLENYGNCTLGSINLGNFILNDKGDMNWQRLEEITRLAIRFLDDVVDVNKFPLPELEEINKKTRRIGLGIMGWADTLVLLDIAYDSDEALELAEKIGKFINDISWDESHCLALKKGVFEDYEKSSLPGWGFPPTRNSSVTNQAPTGCQVKNTYISTNDGILRFDELGNIYGDTWQPLNNVQVYQEYKHTEASKFFINGYTSTKKIVLDSGIELESTYNHKYKIIYNDSYIWKRADEICQGDFIVSSIGEYSKKEEPNLISYVRSSKTGPPNKQIIFPNKMSPPLAKFIGWFFGDGSVHATGIRIHFNKKDNDKIEQFIKLVHDVFNFNPIVREEHTRTSVYISSVPLLNWLKNNELLKSKSNIIFIPKVIRMSSIDSIKAFIDGLFLADGSTSGSTKYIDTTSKQLSQELAICMKAVGINCKIMTYPATKGRKSQAEHYRIVFRKWGSINYSIDSAKGVPHTVKEATMVARKYGDVLICDKVLNIYDSENDTYDIEVPMNNTYISNGVISHNSISRIANVSSGIEPYFDVGYISNILWEDQKGKTSKFIDIPYTIKNKIEQIYGNDSSVFESFVTDSNMKDKILSDIGINRDILRTALDISPEWHTKMQSAWQNNVSNSVSKTVNFSSSATIEEVSDTYFLAWTLGCKGITVYRSGSREKEVLVSSSTPVAGLKDLVETTTPKSFKRPVQVEGLTDRVNTGHGGMFVTINSIDGHEIEVIGTMGKAGGCEHASMEAITRLISTALQGGITKEEVIKQLRGITCCPVWDRGQLIRSPADGIALVLSKNEDVKALDSPPESVYTYVNNNACPDCGNSLEMSEGCQKCRVCGYSRCG